MRVLLTGNRGYLGSVLQQVLDDASDEVTGLDAGLFDLAPEQPGKDIRDLTPADLEGHDAVVHLAALCNDACGDLSATATHEINQVAAIRLASMAREAGVPRFVFASSCSVYGAADGQGLDENSPVAPGTDYAVSKIEAERAVVGLATGSFAPVALRFATLFGMSPSFRSDILVNRVVGTAARWGLIQVNGDGKLWRPLLHVRDAALAIRCALTADPSLVSGETYNIGSPRENHRLIDVVRMVQSVFPAALITHRPVTDQRSYAVRFDKFMNVFGHWQPTRSVMDGIREVADAYRATLLDDMKHDTDGWARTDRCEHLVAMRSAGLLDEGFRWTRAPEHMLSIPSRKGMA